MSGVQHKLSERPQGKRLFDKLRRGDQLTVRWLDRLGRDYQDVTDTVRTFIRMGVKVRTVINQMEFDGSTTDPVQMAVRDALIGFLAATAQAQAEATKFAQRAGIDAAKQNPQKYLGRKPSFSRDQVEQITGMFSQGLSAAEIARSVGVNRHVVMRVRNSPSSVETALLRWGM